MKQAQLPVNESARLQSLKELNILDTEVEQRYDELTALAAKICSVPICLISLIDENRQWFKSHHGLEVRETPREIAFCSHTILGDDIMEICDSRKDERFFDNPLVTDAPDVIFYAGMPLTDTSSNNLGTLCVIDNEPHELNEDQRTALRTIGHQVQTQFELRRALAQIKQQLSDAHEVAKAKSIFMANISHEIKSPLQGIGGATKRLKASDLDDRQRRLVSMLEASGESLVQLNRDVIGLAEIEANRLKVMAEPFDLDILLQEVADGFESRVQAQNNQLKLSISTELEQAVIGDINLVRQILTHLLAHANNVTHGGELTLDARRVMTKGITEGQQCQDVLVFIKLTDQGARLPESVSDNLFERFEKVNACDAGALASTGIGLAIAKKMTNLLGGNLSVDTTPALGSAFNLDLKFVSSLSG